MNQPQKKRSLPVAVGSVLCGLAGLALVAESIQARVYSAGWGIGILLPLGVGLLLILLPLLQLLFRKTPPIRKSVKTPILVVFTLLVLFFVLVEGYILTGPARLSSPQSPSPLYVVVLGCAVAPNGEPTLALEYRLERALQYGNAHPGIRYVTTGGQGSNEPESEARVMAEWLMKHGVQEEDILLENQSTSTLENLVFARKVILAEEERNPSKLSLVPITGNSRIPIAVVTNGFHLARADMLASRCGYAPTSLAAPTPWVIAMNVYVREFFAVIKSFVIDRP